MSYLPLNKKTFLFGTIGTYIFFERYFMTSLSLSKEESYISDCRKIFFFKSLFGRSRSRLVGKLLNLNLPTPIRRKFYGFLINRFLFEDSCNADYSKKEKIEKFEQKLTLPLESYKSIGELFTRLMKPSEINIQEIDNLRSITSPCEGKMLEYGKVDSDKCIQLKSSTFRISELLQEDFRSLITDSNLYYAIIYLSPKNYHRFHTPSKIKINQVRHISGECFPVFKRIASRLNNLFCLNERVVIDSKWEYGKMYIIAVAAHGVSDIRLFCVPELKTNVPGMIPNYLKIDKNKQVIEYNDFEDSKKKGIYNKGDELGLFNLGSTIILLFQVPDKFEFAVNKGEKIKLGSIIGRV